MRKSTMKSAGKPIDVMGDLLLGLVDCSSPEAARRILKFKLSPAKQKRIQNLFERHNEGELSEAELFEYGSFVKFNLQMSILKSKARMLLKSQPEK